MIWMHDDIKFLLHVYEEATIKGRLDGTRRNNFVYREIVERFKKERNMEVQTMQIINKLKNLKREYFRVKNSEEAMKSGLTVTRIYMQFYDEMDQIMTASNNCNQQNHILIDKNATGYIGIEGEEDLAEDEDVANENGYDMDFKMENLDDEPDVTLNEPTNYEEGDEPQPPARKKAKTSSELEETINAINAKLEKQDQAFEERFRAFEERLLRHQQQMHQQNMEWYERMMDRQHQQLMQILQIVIQPQRSAPYNPQNSTTVQEAGYHTPNIPSSTQFSSTNFGMTPQNNVSSQNGVGPHIGMTPQNNVSSQNGVGPRIGMAPQNNIPSENGV